MRARTVVGVAVLGIGLVAVAGLALAADRAPSLLARLRRIPAEFSTAYHAREAELRTALLPSEEDVATARAARRRGAHAAHRADDGFDEDDALADRF